MASHRRARSRAGLLRGTGVVVSTLAVAGFAAGVGQAEPVGGPPVAGTSASADTPGAVEQQVADLYRQGDADTQAFDATEERIAQLQAAVAGDGSRAAQLRDRLATASAGLGRIAAQQYRDAGMSPEMTLVFAARPESYLEQAGVNDRLADIVRRRVVAALAAQRDLAALERESATRLADLDSAQVQLAAHRADVEARLAEARRRLASLGGAQRQQVTAALARGGAGDGLGTTVSASAPSLSSLLAGIAVPPAGVSADMPSPTASASAGAAGKAALSATPSAAASPSASASNPAGSDQAANQPPSPGDTARTIKAVSAAYSALGRPYVWGATGPDQFDCSGLTQHVWGSAGVMLPRTSQEQAGAGSSVPLSDIRPGDLVIYYAGESHVGIYVGQGLVIHAPRPGAVVQFAPVASMPIDKVVRPVR